VPRDKTTVLQVYTALVDQRSSDITLLLRAWGMGDAAALERLTPLVYVELHALARRYMRRENPENSLQATALVNEAYLRLVKLTDVTWQDQPISSPSPLM